MTLDKNNRDLVPSPKMVQGCLFQVEKQCEIDGIEMGVLENGIPYLTEAGLARMCGIDRKVLNRLAIEWPIEKTKPRGMSINSLLNQAGFDILPRLQEGEDVNDIILFFGQAYPW